MEKKQLSCRMIADLLPKLENLNPKIWPRERFIPFCGNEEALLVIDLNTDAVVEWDSDDGAFIRHLITSIFIYSSKYTYFIIQ